MSEIRRVHGLATGYMRVCLCRTSKGGATVRKVKGHEVIIRVTWWPGGRPVASGRCRCASSAVVDRTHRRQQRVHHETQCRPQRPPLRRQVELDTSASHTQLAV